MKLHHVLITAAAALAATALGRPGDVEAKSAQRGLLHDGMSTTLFGAIRSPGLYTLEEDLFVDDLADFQNAFVIAAPRVVIDLKGHSITANGSGAIFRISESASDVTIRNGVLVGGGYGVAGAVGGAFSIDQMGFRGQSADAISLTVELAGGRGVIRNTRIDRISGDGIVLDLPRSIGATGGGEVAMENVVVSNVGGRGIVMDTDDVETLTVTASHVQVDHCGASAVEVTGASSVSIVDSSTSFTGDSAIALRGCRNVEIRRLSASEVEGDGVALAFTSATTVHNDGLHALVADSTVERATGSGVAGYFDFDRIIFAITGNRIADVGEAGIVLGYEGATYAGNFVVGAVLQGRIENNVVERFGKSVAPGPTEGGLPSPCGVANMNVGIAASPDVTGDGVGDVGMLVARNRVSGGNGAGSVGIDVHCAGSTVQDNAAQDVGVGISVTGDENVVVGNVVRNCSAAGVVVAGTGNVLRRNASSGNDRGFVVADATNSLLESNDATANVGVGFDAGDASNFLRSNTGLGNGGGAFFGGTAGPGNVGP